MGVQMSPFKYNLSVLPLLYTIDSTWLCVRLYTAELVKFSWLSEYYMHTKTHKGRRTSEIVRVVCQYVIVNTA